MASEANTVHRRTALKLGAAAAAALAAPAFVRTSAAQQGTDPMANDTSLGFRRFRIGDATVTVVSDGLRPGDGPWPTFGADQEEETVAALLRANFLPEKRFVNGFLPVLVERGADLVLFDTGFGPMGRPNGLGNLRRRMGDAGYAPGDVTRLVLTHMHGDHIGGLAEEDGTSAFPNATYAFGRVEYDWWTSAEAKEGDRSDGAKLVEKLVVPRAEGATFLSDGDEAAPGIVAREAFGHTQGHLVFEMRLGDATFWHLADTSNHYVASLQRPDWRVAFDHVPDLATATRKRVFGSVADAKAPFVGYHMPFPGVGYAERMGEGFRFVPASYQFDFAEG